jgi:hypothetical protein
MRQPAYALLFVFLMASTAWCGRFYVICHKDEQVGIQMCTNCEDPVERDEPYINRADNEKFCGGTKATTFVSMSEAIAWRMKNCGKCK